MILVFKEIVSAAQLYHLPQIHDHNSIGHMVHHGQVVRDKQISKFPLLLNVLHKIQNLCLNRDVQGRYRFITYDELRLKRQCPGNSNTLSTSAVQLVGIGICQTLRQSHRIH